MADETPAAPRPRLNLRLDIDAHDLEDLRSRLESLGHELLIDGREERQLTSSHHGIVRLSCDPEQTRERYDQQCTKWVVARRRAALGAG